MLNRILEISKRASKGGRRKIKLILLTIGEVNKNGLLWTEENVRRNLDSLKLISIVAELDDEKTVPNGHGLTGIYKSDISGRVDAFFENSEVVGALEKGEIEDAEIDGVMKRVLVGYGYIYYQRYPKFFEWLKKNILLSNIDSSIEIVGFEENDGEIIYEEGDNITDELRTPRDFDFSATAILSVPPADDNAIVLEVANKLNKEETKKMDELEMKTMIAEIKAAIAEVISKNDVLLAKIDELNVTVEEKDTAIVDLEAQCGMVKEEMSAKDVRISELEAEMVIKKDELDKVAMASKVTEMESAIKDFTKDEVEVAKELIEKFKEAPLVSEVNEIVAKINEGIVAKLIEDRKKVSEVNSDKDTKDIDIFSEICEAEADANEDYEDISIY